MKTNATKWAGGMKTNATKWDWRYFYREAVAAQSPGLPR